MGGVVGVGRGVGTGAGVGVGGLGRANRGSGAEVSVIRWADWALAGWFRLRFASRWRKRDSESVRAGLEFFHGVEIVSALNASGSGSPGESVLAAKGFGHSDSELEERCSCVRYFVKAAGFRG
jgi:hypothetical protein